MIGAFMLLFIKDIPWLNQHTRVIFYAVILFFGWFSKDKNVLYCDIIPITKSGNNNMTSNCIRINLKNRILKISYFTFSFSGKPSLFHKAVV